MVLHLAMLWKKYPLQGTVIKWAMGVGLAMSCGILSESPAIAQSEALTRAELYRLQNQVQLLPYQQPSRPAAIADPLLPRDGVQTQSQSRAELLFNEGSLARIGANSIFRFVPGLRRYQLPDGSTRAEAVLQLEQGIALVMGPAGSATNQVQTPEAEITIAGGDLPDDAPVPPTSTAVVIVHSPTLATTQVFNLTQNPTTISAPGGTETVTLGAGETLSVTEGVFSAVDTFDLNHFYQTSGLALGLGPNQADQLDNESAQVQAVLNQIRAETVAAANAQASQLAGFCHQDQAAIEADACITTDNTPLNTFEDDRELSTEPEPTAPTAPTIGGPDVTGGGSPTLPGTLPDPVPQ
ncbi:MAG: FecR domain-containing protein [Leptolyngbya sp. SIO1E4]|nr:FecR domain-containing protein [Leptolyngbya sp. SIO1E4]